MKRKQLLRILLLSAVLLHSSAAFAQTRYTASIHKSTLTGIENGYGCPVRYWRGDMSVAYVRQNANQVAFCLIKHSDFSTSFTPPAPTPTVTVDAAVINQDFTVSDIYIVDDYAFFCGHYNSNAMYGYFDINDLLNNTLANINIYFLHDYSTTETAPVSLDKMVAYNDGPFYKVVAYGNSVPDIHDGCYKVVEIANALSPTSPIDVADMPISAPVYYLGNKLYIDDIILTKSNVVLLGHDRKTTSLTLGYPWFAVGNKASVVDDICNTVVFNNYFLPDSTEANDAVKGVALNEDTFAISYVHFVYPDKYYTNFRVIDYRNLGNPFSQQFKKPQKDNPIEMIYLNDLRTVELLQCITDSSNYIQLAPFAASNYITSMFSPDNREYKSLSPIDGKRYISMRSGVVYLEDRTVSLPHSSNLCPDDQYVEVKKIKDLPPVKYPLTGNKIFNNVDPYNELFNCVPGLPTNTDCYSVE